MAKRQYICDVPECHCKRARWQRICPSCYRKLPSYIINNLLAAWREKRMPDWRKWKKEAGEYLHDKTAPNQHITSQQSFNMNARLLGETND